MTPKPDDLVKFPEKLYAMWTGGSISYIALTEVYPENLPPGCPVQEYIRAQPPQDGWKDISTAKCDGSAVDLLLNGNARIPECYFDYYTKEWLTCGTDVPVILQCDPINKITHWMPIPPLPPKPAKTEGDKSNPDDAEVG